MKTSAIRSGNVLTFPIAKSFPPRSQMIPRPTWAMDGSEVATVQIHGNALSGEGINDGDTLILNLRFHRSEIKPRDLVVAKLPDGRNIVRRMGEIKFEPGRIHICGIVMELNRSLSLAS